MDRSGPDVPGIRHGAVSEWLARHVSGLAPPFVFEPIVGGHSNMTYAATDGAGRRFVLRRPPLGAVLATAHDMAREHRIISGVGRTLVPVPRALGLCEDPGVNDAPFYVMDFVEGVVLTGATAVEQHFRLERRRAIAHAAIDTLAALHRVEPERVGLGDLGRREAYLARQLKRWHRQWESSKTRELAAMDEVHALLEARIPPQQGAAIVHGDYRLGNLLIDAGGGVAAVLDWELCTLGDPLADLGYLLNNWVLPGEEGLYPGAAALSPSTAPGFPAREELIERYAAASGRDVGDIAYYRAFQYWRFAAIMEGVLSRYQQGVMADAGDLAAFRTQVEGAAAAALDFTRGLDS